MEPDSTVVSLCGGCQCGAVRYEVAERPREVSICHCRECRKQSSSAFGISVLVARATLRVVRGTPRFWSRGTDSGRRLACAFCPDCGTRLWHQRAGAVEPDSIISIKGGSLDEPVDVTAAAHYWTSRKLPGIVIPPGAAQFATESD